MRRSSRIHLSLLAATMLAGCGYNTIQTMDERVNQAQGQVQTQLQRRNDLIPNLVATVRGVAKQESSQTFRQLQAQLEATETGISVARQDYNTAVGEYNAYIRRFPYNLTAKVFGLGNPREYFEAEEGAREAPEVK